MFQPKCIGQVENEVKKRKMNPSRFFLCVKGGKLCWEMIKFLGFGKFLRLTKKIESIIALSQEN